MKKKETKNIPEVNFRTFYHIRRFNVCTLSTEPNQLKKPQLKHYGNYNTALPKIMSFILTKIKAACVCVF